MKRSGGVTVIAILSLLGSTLTFAIGILMLVIMNFVPASRPDQIPPSPIPLKLIFVMSALVYLLPAIWGVLTGIGLWRLRNWARISTIVFSVLLILMGGFAGLMTLFIPFPLTPTPGANPAMMGGIRAVMGMFWLALTGIGVWWAVFFNRSKVKAQFGQTPLVLEDGSQIKAGYSLQGSVDPDAGKRPLSITIIAWFLLVGCFFIPLTLLLRPPAVLFTRILTAWPAVLFYLFNAAAQLCIGIGLLRLGTVARTAAIIYFAFFFVNTVVFDLWPGAHDRLLALIQGERSMFPWMRVLPNQPEFQYDMTPFLIFGAFCALAGVAVPLYFLITRRFAFETSPAD